MADTVQPSPNGDGPAVIFDDPTATIPNIPVTKYPVSGQTKVPLHYPPKHYRMWK